MAANGKTVRIFASKGNPSVEIIFGKAQWARYRIDLWDKEGLDYQRVGHGLNTDEIPDSFAVNSQQVTDLDGRLLSWEASIAAYSEEPGQTFSVVVRISQQGKAVKDGVVVEGGSLDKAVYFQDFVRLEVV